MKAETPTEAPDASSYDEGEEAIRFVEAAWNDAARLWDVERLTAIYTDDAVFFGGRPGHSIGSDAIRTYFESYVGVLHSSRLKLVEQVLVSFGPDAYVAQGYGQFQFILSGGGGSVNELRTTLVLVRRGKHWRIAQHHFSATPDSPPIPGQDKDVRMA